jgi:hypothetical protein
MIAATAWNHTMTDADVPAPELAGATTFAAKA